MEVVQKPNVDNEIEEALNLLNKELTTQDDKTKEVAIKKEEEDITSFEFLTKKALGNIDIIDKTADDIHELFFRELVLKRDYSESSKVAMIEALRIKSDNVKTIAEFTKSLAKLKAANDNRIGIQINTQSGEAVGINLNNLMDEC